MSTATKTYLIYAPDFTDSAPRRAKARPSHLEKAKIATDEGIIIIGGAMLDEEGAMKGSTLIVKAESLQAVKEMVENDIYYKDRVWDPEKLVITEFRAATQSKP